MFTLIPAIDLIDGRCVRLEQGDYTREKKYADDPLLVAQQFEAVGLKRLHLVDLDGARAGHVKNLAVLERIATNTKLIIDFGGGVKSEDEVQAVLDAGAKWIAVGSIAVKEPERFHKWIARWSADRFFIGADVRDGKLAVTGWTEQTTISAIDFIQKWQKAGVHQFFCTDISRDGLLQGPALDFYKALLLSCSGLRLTASGGVSTVADLHALREIGCEAAIVGKALYENRITRNEIQNLFVAKT
jgi:phosphoribosylformimino-5-aminoimidazole carboxamide ribotide isomerase